MAANRTIYPSIVRPTQLSTYEGYRQHILSTWTSKSRTTSSKHTRVGTQWQTLRLCAAGKYHRKQKPPYCPLQADWLAQSWDSQTEHVQELLGRGGSPEHTHTEPAWDALWAVYRRGEEYHMCIHLPHTENPGIGRLWFRQQRANWVIAHQLTSWPLHTCMCVPIQTSASGEMEQWSFLWSSFLFC